MKKPRSAAIIALFFASSLLHASDSTEYIKEAQQYLESGELKSAVIQLKNALQENPSAVDARLMLGKIYLQLRDGASAEKELKHAKKLNKPREHWELELGQAYLLQRKFHQIIDEIQETPDTLAETRAKISLLRGEAFFGLRNLPEARTAFANAKELQPDFQKAIVADALVDIALNKPDEAISTLTSLLEKHPENTDALVTRGELRRQAKKTELAMKDFEQTLLLNEHNIRALQGRATINLAKGESGQVKKDLDTLGQLIPGSPFLLYVGGLVAFQQHDFDLAEELLQQLLMKSPGNARSQLVLGAVYVEKGNFQLADDYLSQVLESAPGNLPALKLLAGVRYKRNKIDELIKLLEPAVSRYPEELELKAMLGSAYLKQRRFDEGAELMSQVVKMNPDVASLRTNLALGLMAQGKTEMAIEELQTAVKLGQDFIQADILLISSYLRNNETEKALEASLALEERAKDNPVGYNISGMAYFQSGEQDKAEEKFRQALKVDPGFITAEINLARLEIARKQLDKAEKHYYAALKKNPDDPRVYMGLAELAEKNGDPKAMHDWLDKAVANSPRSSLPGILSAQAYFKEGKTLKGFQVATELASSFPKDPAVMRLLGGAQFATGKIHNAIDTFKQLVELRESAMSLHILGEAQREAKQLSDARDSYSRALELNPDYFLSEVAQIKLQIISKDYDQALDNAGSLQKKYPDKSIGYELASAIYTVQGQYEQAIPLIEKAIEIEPKVKLILQLSQQYNLAGKRERGLDILREWRQKKPDDVSIRSVLAMSLQTQNRLDEAMVEYKKVLELDPNHITSLNNLAWLYSEKGDSQAVDLGRRAYGLAKNRPEIVDTFGWILVQTGELSEGERVLREAVALAPEHQEIIYHLGYSLHKLDRQDEAQAMLRRAIRVAPETAIAEKMQTLLIAVYEKVLDGDARNLLALNTLAGYYLKKDSSKAVTYSRRAYEQSKKSPEIVDAYGWILVQAGDLEKGAEILRKAVNLAPKNQQIIYHFGYSLDKLGRQDEAQIMLRRAIKLSSETEVAKMARAMLN